MEKLLVPGVRKIAVLRANALGDLIMGLPAHAALKAAYPGAELVLLANPWHRNFMHGRPGPIDRVVVIPVTEGLRLEDGTRPDPREITTFFERMQAEAFDLALQLHGGGRYSNPFILRLGARLTAGQCTADAARLDRCLPYHYYHHEVIRCLETVGLVGADPTLRAPRLALTAADEADLERSWPRQDQRYVVIHPGVTDPLRRWPAEKYAAVGDALAARHYTVVVSGSEWESEIVDRVIQAMQRPAIRLCGQINQGGLAALLAHALLVITNDTGPAHMARALGTPVIAVFWGPNLITAGPLGRVTDRVAVSWQLHCPVCGFDYGRGFPYVNGGRCEHQDSLVAPVPVEEVLAYAEELLAVAPDRCW